MLFNSYPFLFVFLPGTLALFQICSRFGSKAVVPFLGIASLLFYGYWKPSFLPVLGSSILFNFIFASLIARRIPNRLSTRVLLWTAVAFNLGLLCWFKYLFPLLNYLSAHWYQDHAWADVALPLGISFFTFTQLGYLIDLQQGAAKGQSFWNYLLFVTFFPHLIAGPILHHHDMMPQFEGERDWGLRLEDFAVGLAWVTMGMFKKVVLADPLAANVSTVFSAHGAVSAGDAWVGALTYALQLYFDFSGYSDMACGLARMFSIDFPLNFSSPFKAASVIEFWQRWHITLSQYINSYVYTPLQRAIAARRQTRGKKVSRKAQTTPGGYFEMIAFPIIATMFFAGVWHGAGLAFIVFGVLHGVFLSVNHGWRNFRHYRGMKAPGGLGGIAIHVGSVLLTFSAVLLATIFFRAADVPEGWHLLQRMLHMQVAETTAAKVGLANPHRTWMRMVLGYVIVWALPNTQQILARYRPGLRLVPTDSYERPSLTFWRPNGAWALLLGSAFAIAVVNMQNPSSFLYFQF